MADILTPTLGESVSEATVARWTKAAGDAVKKDEVLVELDTDKVSVEVSAPEDGVLSAILVEEGGTVTPGQLLGSVGAAGAAPAKKANGKAAAAPPPTQPATAAAPAGELQPDTKAGAGVTAPERELGREQQTPAAPPAAADATPAPAAAAGAVDITVPTMGESVSEGAVGRWTKAPGDVVKKDEVLVEIETDKVAVEVSAPTDGVLAEILVNDGGTVGPGQTIARITPAGSAGPAVQKSTVQSPAPARPAVAVMASPVAERKAARPDLPLAPSVQRIVSEEKLDPASIPATGKDGRITKGDALAELERRAVAARAEPAVQVAAAPRPEADREERVRMTRLRQTIARRLKEAQNTAAMLTTFNEVDMSAVMALREKYKEGFEKTHGVKLGFMSFFVRAAVAALKAVPAVNAEIDGADLIYKNHYDIGVAVGTEKGLVVPVLRDADALSLAGIEKGIAALGKKARDGQLTIDDMQGGTFTISNGGVYGSLMSTPILNAPQSGILGMHKIQERPMVVGGQIVARPMMYLALSYDHRIVDGKEAVTWLVRLKEGIEDPQRLLLDV